MLYLSRSTLRKSVVCRKKNFAINFRFLFHIFSLLQVQPKDFYLLHVQDEKKRQHENYWWVTKMALNKLKFFVGGQNNLDWHLSIFIPAVHATSAIACAALLLMLTNLWALSWVDLIYRSGTPFQINENGHFKKKILKITTWNIVDSKSWYFNFLGDLYFLGSV